MHFYTPDDLVCQFKEANEFLLLSSEVLVQEIKKRASHESTLEAAKNVYILLQANPPDSFGWLLIKSISFIISG